MIEIRRQRVVQGDRLFGDRAWTREWRCWKMLRLWWSNGGEMERSGCLGSGKVSGNWKENEGKWGEPSLWRDVFQWRWREKVSWIGKRKFIYFGDFVFVAEKNNTNFVDRKSPRHYCSSSRENLNTEGKCVKSNNMDVYYIAIRL